MAQRRIWNLGEFVCLVMLLRNMNRFSLNLHDQRTCYKENWLADFLKSSLTLSC